MGPLDLSGRLLRDDALGNLPFSQANDADLSQNLGVTAVVRLNEPKSDREVLIARGIVHVELPFADGAAPPAPLARSFFAAVDAALGRVAVPCSAGLGRTGTLIALYMMKHLRFSAREAMGWLRVMRPGSVIGEPYSSSTSPASITRCCRRAGAGQSGIHPAAAATAVAGDGG
jgi:hypothetical protein